MSDSEVAERLKLVRAQVAGAVAEAGRTDEVRIVAVSKTVPAERVLAAYHAGQRLFGENRVQEGTAKIADLSGQMPDADWHLIGHLQTNKVRAAVEGFSIIESVDSVRLAQKLNDAAGAIGRTIPVLLEVNMAGEPSKSGFSPSDLRSAVAVLIQLPHIELIGLMTVAPLMHDPQEVRPVFRDLRRLRDAIAERLPLTSFRELSMGMSGDFRVAIEEGATIVRIGRAIFGERPAGGQA